MEQSEASVKSWGGECLKADDGAPFQQGDIIKFSKVEHPWKKWGVIVTADCDIDKGKHLDVLSYVPLLELHEYWRLFTLPKILKKSELGFIKQATDKVKSIYKKNVADVDISQESVHALIMGGADDGIMELLKIQPEDKEHWSRILSVYRRLEKRTQDIGFKDMVVLLAETKTVISSSPGDTVAVLKDIEKTVESLPGDIFFISKIPDEEKNGYVAYLRLVREIDSKKIAIVAKDLRNPVTEARRIGRMKSPYLYRLTQQLAQVFSDIGLPVEYEAERTSNASKTKLDLINILKGDVNV